MAFGFSETNGDPRMAQTHKMNPPQNSHKNVLTGKSIFIMLIL
jgi:hypothetical protein